MVVGGYHFGYHAHVELYEFTTAEWSVKSDYPYGNLYDAPIVEVNEYFYVFGGVIYVDANLIASVDEQSKIVKYSPDIDNWTPLGDLQSAR